jgi:phage-related protein
MARGPDQLKPVLWMRSAKRDFIRFPAEVQDSFGFALFLAQSGGQAPIAKQLRGFGGGVIELVEDFDGNAYRAIYTVRFAHAVYVLHAFQKKSKTGIKTPQADIELIRRRLKDAADDFAAHFGREDRT